VSETIALQWGNYSFPRSGVFVQEDHYATTDETFAPGNSLFPDTVSEDVTSHLQASCDLLHNTYGFTSLSHNCTEVYITTDENQWTPAEGGRVGQGAVGNNKPTAIQEMWQGNLMYASGAKPAPGTKYILSHNGKSAVVSFGFEVGPSSQSYLGGLTTEVHWYLGDNTSANITMGRAADQTLAYGPVTCN
jgi:hypothetical protein